MILTLAVLLGIVSSADICDRPLAGGVGEPGFCRFSEPQPISTPFFFFIAEPDVLVGVHRDGARVVVEGSIRQSPIGLVIEAAPPVDRARILETFGRCGDISPRRDNVLVCDRSSAGITAKTFLIQGRLSVLLVYYTAAGTALEQQASFMKMIDSINADGRL